MAATLKEQIYNAIWEGIVNGEFPSNHVFNEKALIEKYNVSKSPVRDALIELCNDGILRSIPRYGYEIVHITNKQFHEINRIRMLIEMDNLNFVMDTITERDIAQLKAYVSETDEALKQGEITTKTHWNNNVGFHKLLYSISNNEFGSLMLERCLKPLMIAYSISYKPSNEKYASLNTDSHWAILHCMESKDKQGAINALKGDLESFQI